MEASSKAFLLFSLLPDWLKLNHLKSRMECGFSDIFCAYSFHGSKTIGVTDYAASFGAKKCSENHIWSCWDNAWSVEQTIACLLFISLKSTSSAHFRSCTGAILLLLTNFPLNFAWIFARLITIKSIEFDTGSTYESKCISAVPLPNLTIFGLVRQ